MAGWVRALAALDTEVGDAERIDQIRAMEELKAAARTTLTVGFVDSQHAAAGVPARERGQHLGPAQSLVREFPCAVAASRGRPPA